MTITPAYEGSFAIHTTEYSLPNNANYAIGSPLTATGIYQAFINLTAMANGDSYQIKLYEKIAAATGVQITVDIFTLEGVQSGAVVIPSAIFMSAWDITVKQITRFTSSTASGMNVEWSIRKVA